MVKSPALLASLFGYLATDFAALIGRGMDIEIPLAGHQAWPRKIHKRSECGWAEVQTCLRSFQISRKACIGGPTNGNQKSAEDRQGVVAAPPDLGRLHNLYRELLKNPGIHKRQRLGEGARDRGRLAQDPDRPPSPGKRRILLSFQWLSCLVLRLG